MSARERILARVRDALEDRPHVGHPGPFTGPRPHEPASPVDGFVAAFTRAGGEVERVADQAAAAAWLAAFLTDTDKVAVGSLVPPAVHPGSTASPEEAAVGISMARGAVAETGSLVLDARDGRRTQLLPPTHVVLVHTSDVMPTLVTALGGLRRGAPSAVGLHSGPSKSADIGQILVRGVHGPGRVVALLLGD